jgi:hypothetical protein
MGLMSFVVGSLFLVVLSLSVIAKNFTKERKKNYLQYCYYYLQGEWGRVERSVGVV